MPYIGHRRQYLILPKNELVLVEHPELLWFYKSSAVNMLRKGATFASKLEKLKGLKLIYYS